MSFTIRRLNAEDAEACVALRREMLNDSPLAFLASPDDDIGTDLEVARERLSGEEDNVIFGAFDSELVGSVGMLRERHRKARHKLHLWGMYVAPRARKRGVGRQLLEAVISHAQEVEGAKQVHLSVSESAPDAKALYESVGFQVWGREPRALIHDRQCMDELHMVLFLTT